MIVSSLPHRVTIQKLARSAVGGSVEVVQSWTDVQALVQGKQQATFDREGRSVTAQATVFLGPDAPIDLSHDDWRIEWENREWEVLAFTKHTDALTGFDHHIQLMVR